jgi:hypothetical protein
MHQGTWPGPAGCYAELGTSDAPTHYSHHPMAGVQLLLLCFLCLQAAIVQQINPCIFGGFDVVLIAVLP